MIPHLRGNKYGKIVNLSGGGATAPLPRISAYAAGKAAVVRLTETLAHELADARVDVNAIAPGPLNTRLLQEVLAAGPERVGKDFYERSLKQKADGGAPLEKGAALAVYLASAQSDGISGRLFSALWDDWQRLAQKRDALGQERHLYAAAHHAGGSGAEMALRVAIVGCGLIGHKRAKAAGEHPLVATADANPQGPAACRALPRL